ncbi:MAG TPA: hypothetical protein VFR31_20815 [Thermoanaerobaculia bacterium]|nr:hypothetical protein [Thermoanaerobaculia bacterium]
MGSNTASTESPAVAWKSFLESFPPQSQSRVTALSYERFNEELLSTPELTLHCASCDGERIFHCRDSRSAPGKHFSDVFLNYSCRNCNHAFKTYAVAVRCNAEGHDGEARKYGEWPSFGLPVPNRVLKLFEEDRELFLKGRRAENQGMGIAAFAYYRRVVENKRTVLIENIARVAERVGVDNSIVQQLRAAKESWQFTRSIEPIKDIIPERLKIDGQNPLILLHNALSDGLHDKSDEHCLELATSIRLVITELADRMAEALKDDADLKMAVRRLSSRTREE